MNPERRIVIHAPDLDKPLPPQPDYIAPEALGLGSALKNIIHASLDILPISDVLREKVKGCGACGKRVVALNAVVPNINPFAKPSDPPPALPVTPA